MSLTFFAFDQGEGLSTHAAAGEVSLTIEGKEVVARRGEVVVMPSDVPHSVNALRPFKMLLTLVKKPKDKSAKRKRLFRKGSKTKMKSGSDKDI